MVNERPRRWGEIRTTRQRTYRLDPDDSPQSPKPRYGGIITEVRGNQVTETTTRRQRLTEAARQVGADTLTAGKVVGRHVGRAGKSAARSAARLSVNQLRQIDRLGLADTDDQAASLLRQGATHARRTSKSTIKGSMHAAKVVAKRFLPGVPPAPKLTKHQPGLIGRLTRKLIRGGTKKFVAAGRTGIRSGIRTAGSSLRAGGHVDADRAAFRAAQTAWQKPTRFGLKQAGRPVKWAARHTARAAMRATARLTILGAKTVIAAMGAAGALLPVLIGIIGIVAALCAILPSFITGAGAENHRRQQAAQPTCVGGSTPGYAVTAAEVAEFLPNPGGVDASSVLTAEQRSVATAIVEEGQKAGVPAKGWAIALMTAMQESTMGANQSTKRPNADGDVGVFQQRALVGWYADGASRDENTAILNDVHYAARTFYLGHDVGVLDSRGAGAVGYHIPGLVDVKGWESEKNLGKSAQAVQRSAYPNYYSYHEATVASLLPTIQTQGCTAITTGGSPVAGVDDYAPVRRGREGVDDWAFYWGECVSYVAFMIRTHSPHTDFHNLWRDGKWQPEEAHFGNAKMWDERAKAVGVRVDTTPAVGAVAQHSRNGYGHVAYITAVHEDGTFDVNEYNHGPRHKFGTRSHVSIPKDFDVVIHFEEPLKS